MGGRRVGLTTLDDYGAGWEGGPYYLGDYSQT